MQKATFERLYHCPRTGKIRGACPGYIIDHVVPLCAGGAYDPLNTQMWRNQDFALRTGDVLEQTYRVEAIDPKG